jgi:hypothetical protein
MNSKMCELCGSSFLDQSRTNKRRFCCKYCQQKAWTIKHKIVLKEQRRQYHLKHKTKIQTRVKEWRKNNLTRSNQHCAKYKQKYKTGELRLSLNEKIKHALRTRLNDALNGRTKVGSAIKNLNCSIEELKTYLESKFQEGMSWENHSLHGWHIDHIVPLASFNLEDPEELKKACHYTNLQPLWAEDNLKKATKT